MLDPSDDLFRSGTESVLLAASIEQARIVYRFVRENLEPTGRLTDSWIAVTRCGITHAGTNTRLRIIGSEWENSYGVL